MNQGICESKHLIQFLDGTLHQREVERLTEHLEECVACRKELEKHAASVGQWRDAKACLSRKTETKLKVETGSGSKALPFTIRQLVSMLNPTDDPSALGRLGGFEVMGVVGHGAMGVVLKAVDRALDRVVALKVINPTFAECATARYRFGREAKAAAGVLHPNVIPIHSVSTQHELPYLVMPYIAGPSLQQRMDCQGPLELVEVLRVGSQIAAGLVAAHEKGLIHRDIKPANVMLDEGVETAVITDFGLAQTIDDATMTRTGTIAGTPEYMSPEQAQGESVDCNSDVFSLASLLYALCTGHPPFRAKTSFGVLRKITDEQPRPIRDLNSQMPRWLCTLIEEMHAKSASERPSSAEVHDQLVAFLAHVYQPDHNPLPNTRAKQLSWSKPAFRTLVLIGSITMTILVTVAIICVVQFGTGVSDGATESSTKTSSAERREEETPIVFKSIPLEFPNAKQRGKLVVDITRGFIEVAGHDQDNVVIEILTPPEFESGPGKISDGKDLAPVFAPKYDLISEPNENSITIDTYNQNYVLNLRIKVPFKTDLTLDTYRDGYIDVENVSGTIHTQSEHNDIRLSEIEGSATAFSQNGDLKIRFKQVAMDALLDFETNNGDIDLTLPKAIRLSTAICAGRGSYRSAFQDEFTAASRPTGSELGSDLPNLEEYQFGKINGGGVPLRIQSQKGSIRLRKLFKNPDDMPLRLSR
ncbi:MAG: protein kinase [Planctomycetota bacterium]